MGRIQFPHDPDATPQSKQEDKGLALLITQSIKFLPHMQSNIAPAVIEKLLTDIHKPDVSVYVTHSDGESYELVAIDKKGGRPHCFQVQTNEGLAITDLAEVKRKNLSEKSQTFYTELINGLQEKSKIEPSSPAPGPRR